MDANNLTDEQKQIVQQLTAQESAKAKYTWDENFQKRILALALTDSEFLIQAFALIKPEYFTNEAHSLICKILFELFEKDRMIPESFVIKQFMKEKINSKPEPVKIYFEAEVESIYEAFVPNISSRGILLEKVLKFARIQELKIAMAISNKELKDAPEDEDVWLKAEDRIKKALSVNKVFDAGYDFLVDREKFYEELLKVNEGQEKFSSGFNKIEHIVNGGWQRGELHSFMALTGQGKSLALSKVAVDNLKRGKKVVFVSLELSWVTICQRLVGQFTGFDVNHIPEHKHEIEELFEMYLQPLEDKNLFNVKQYPLGTPTVNDIRAFLNNIKSKGFKYDIVIIDYAGEVKPYPNVKNYESQAMIMRDLKCLAQEDNVLVITAMQSNKEGTKIGQNESLGLGNIAASFDQAQKLDGIWSITRTPNEVEAGYGRITGVKVRNGQTGISFPVKFERKSLEIFECSEDEYNQAMHFLATEKAGNISIDNTGNKKKKKSQVEDLENAE
jgi:replicative DNA helicase